jgi:uncharacterized protein involved in exopolysaccharide biosynthesis
MMGMTTDEPRSSEATAGPDTQAIVKNGERETGSGQGSDLSILDLLVLLAEHWRLLLIGPLVVGLSALAISFLLTPRFQSTARILPPQQSGVAALLASQMGSLAGLAGAAAGIKSPADQFVSMLRSRTIFDEVIERFKLRELYGTRYIEETRKELDNRISITAGVKDGVISVEVEDIDPKRAADMANTFVELLGSMVRQLPLTEAAQRRTYFEKKLAETRANLDAAQLSLRSSNVDRGVLKAEPRAAIEEVARLKAAVTATEVRVASMRGFLTESNPDMRQAAQELAALRGQLAMAEKGNSTTDAAGSDYLSKYRDVKYHELLFELMARQYELAKLDETRDGPVVQVVDKAVPAEWKSKPKRALIAVITTIATGLALFAWLVVRELLGAAETQPNSERKVRRLKAAFGRRGV